MANLTRGKRVRLYQISTFAFIVTSGVVTFATTAFARHVGSSPFGIIHRNIEISWYSVESNNGGTVTSTGVRFHNNKNGLCAISLRAFDVLGLRYMDVLRITAPNGRSLLCAVVDAGSLHNNGKRNANRHIDLPVGFFEQFGYSRNVGLIRGATIEVVERHCHAAPQGTNKCPGYRGSLAALGEQLVANAVQGKAGVRGDLVAQAQLQGRQFAEVTGAREIWQKLTDVAQRWHKAFNNSNTTASERKDTRPSVRTYNNWELLNFTLQALNEAHTINRQAFLNLLEAEHELYYTHLQGLRSNSSYFPIEELNTLTESDSHDYVRTILYHVPSL